MEENELQEMAAFMQFAEEQLKQLEMQHQVIAQGIEDLSTTMVTIENMDKEAADGDGNLHAVIPIGDSGFIRTSMKKPAGYLVPVGARYFIEAGKDASMKVLEAQREKMQATLGAIQQRMKQLTEQAEKVRPVLEQQVQSMRANDGEGLARLAKKPAKSP
ncbi:MAG: prefoldin subunit alpha [Candidatus Lokiarchaeota archaeon]|nr:prefoldin subunit alpha [Candidatus Lokiarchaeota archaeon]